MNYALYYGENADIEAIEQRYRALEDRFSESGVFPEAFYSSSGRAEVLGNHTDHQCGKVLVSAISCDVAAAVGRRNDGMVEICSEGFAPIRFSLKDTAMRARERGKSIAMARGVANAIQARGWKVGGFTAYTDSTVFRGAGVSSSAAFEVLLVEIFNDLYLEGRLSKVEKAAIGQFAEDRFFGKPCGLLDQSGVAYGGLNLIDFEPPKAPKSEQLAIPKGYSLVITNTGGSHAELTEHYAAIKKEMKEVASCFGKEVLRQVPFEKFFDAIPLLRKKVSERAILRAFHFYDENERVERAAKALKFGNTSEFLSAVNESGESSLTLLQNAFVPGSTSQPIVLGLRMSKTLIRDGAVRLHGGGFAGTIIAILSDAEEANYVARMSGVFGAENVFPAKIRPVGACRVDR